MLLNEIKEEFEKKSRESISKFRQRIASLRVGRPDPGLVEFLTVEAYGQKLPLRQLSSIGVIPPNQISIQAWDESAILPIKKAIERSGLGLTPQVEGKTIRLTFSPLSQEKREELKKILGKKKEEEKISLKTIRHEFIKDIERLFEEDKISEDEKFRAKEEIQKRMEEFNKEVEEASLRKEKEIMED